MRRSRSPTNKLDDECARKEVSPRNQRTDVRKDPLMLRAQFIEEVVKILSDANMKYVRLEELVREGKLQDGCEPLDELESLVVRPKEQLDGTKGMRIVDALGL